MLNTFFSMILNLVQKRKIQEAKDQLSLNELLYEHIENNQKSINLLFWFIRDSYYQLGTSIIESHDNFSEDSGTRVAMKEIYTREQGEFLCNESIGLIPLHTFEDYLTCLVCVKSKESNRQVSRKVLLDSLELVRSSALSPHAALERAIALNDVYSFDSIFPHDSLHRKSCTSLNEGKIHS